jgi:hypothetical protein
MGKITRKKGGSSRRLNATMAVEKKTVQSDAVTLRQSRHIADIIGSISQPIAYRNMHRIDPAEDSKF